MKYCFTTMTSDDVLIKKRLLAKGYYVYDLRDCEGEGYTIEPRVLVNNIGQLVTDEKLPLIYEGHRYMLTDDEFEALNWEEDPDLIAKAKPRHLTPEEFNNASLNVRLDYIDQLTDEALAKHCKVDKCPDRNFVRQSFGNYGEFGYTETPEDHFVKRFSDAPWFC